MIVLGYHRKPDTLFPSVPGIKLGLSNCVLLIALYWLGVRISFEMMAGQGSCCWAFMFGNPMMIVYSLAGGTLSLAVMTLLVNRKGV